MVQSAAARPGQRSYLLIRVPKSLITVKPKFALGDWMPLEKWFQDTPGVIHYGQIVGISLRPDLDDPNVNEWQYELMAPHWHSKALDLDTVRESELIARLKEVTKR